MSSYDPSFSLKDIWRDFHAVNTEKNILAAFRSRLRGISRILISRFGLSTNFSGIPGATDNHFSRVDSSYYYSALEG
jgi:hypothetical protein